MYLKSEEKMEKKERIQLPAWSHHSASQAHQFLIAIFGASPSGLIEIRLIRKKEVRQFFYRKPRQVVKDLFTNKAHLLNSWNVYFGACPRKEKRGSEKDISWVGALFADIDCASEEERERRLTSLKNFYIPPSIIVSSGRGFHAYWLLARRYIIENKKGLLHVKGYIKGLALVLGGDKAFDLSRVLRLPGTKNLKDPQHPLPVRVLEIKPTRKYGLEDFQAFWVKVEDTPHTPKIDPEDIPDRFWRILQEDQKLKDTWQGRRDDLEDNTRSGYDMALASLAMGYGFTDGEIANILRLSPSGKGADAKPQYLTLTVGKARKSWNDRRVVTLDDVRETFSRWLYLPDTNVIDVVMATILANRIRQADPLWVFLVAPPSGTKTEILRTLQQTQNVYYLSSLTPHTFISGKTQTGKQETSLLMEIKEGILVIKDFGSILEMRHDDRGEILAQLREIADGKYDKRFGTGKAVHWEGKLGFLAAATPIIDEYLSVKQVLGERFIVYRIPHEDKVGLAMRAINNLAKEEEMRKELSDITRRFLSQFGSHIELPDCKDKVKTVIVSLAVVIARARSTVPRERFGDRMIKHVPDPEIPARLSKQLYLLASGLTLAWAEEEVTEKVYPVLRKMAFDTIPSQRAKVITYLWKTQEEWVRTRTVATAIRYPTTTARYILEDLNVLQIVDQRLEGGIEGKEVGRTTPYEWRLNQEFMDLLEKLPVLEN